MHTEYLYVIYHKCKFGALFSCVRNDSISLKLGSASFFKFDKVLTTRFEFNQENLKAYIFAAALFRSKENIYASKKSKCKCVAVLKENITFVISK